MMLSELSPRELPESSHRRTSAHAVGRKIRALVQPSSWPGAQEKAPGSPASLPREGTGASGQALPLHSTQHNTGLGQRLGCLGQPVWFDAKIF